MSEVRRQVALPPRPNWGWQDAAACRGKEVVLFFGPVAERIGWMERAHELPTFERFPSSVSPSS